jgi:hypothetical protein
MLSEIPSEMIQRVKDLTGVELKDTAESYQDSIQIQLGILLLQLFNIRQLKAINKNLMLLPDIH